MDLAVSRRTMSSKSKAVLAVYLSGLLQGIALIIFPAAGPLLTDPQFHGLSSAQFGVLFTPQIAAAIVASTLAARLAARVGMKRILLAGLGFNLAAMLLLAASHFAIGAGDAAFAVLLLATGAVGAGFGLTLTALNAFAFDLFPGRQDSAVTGLHVLTGTGQVGASLILGLFLGFGIWWGAAVTVGGALLLMILFQLSLPLRLSSETTQARMSQADRRIPMRVWLYAASVFLYGACEATFGNWSPIFLEREAGFSMASAALGLSIFWASVTAGRVLFAVLALRVDASLLYVLSPFVVAASFVALPLAGDMLPSLAVLALAGLALSFYFPYSVSLASAEHPHLAAVVSGALVAAIQLGTGVSANLVGSAGESLPLSAIFQASALYAVAMGAIAIYLRATKQVTAQLSVLDAHPDK